MPVPQIPGFYYDEEKRKYFKILNGGHSASNQVNKYHNNSVQAEKRRKLYKDNENTTKYKVSRSTSQAISISKQAFQTQLERKQFEPSYEGLLRLKTGNYDRTLPVNRDDLLDIIPSGMSSGTPTACSRMGFQEYSTIKSTEDSAEELRLLYFTRVPIVQRVPKSFNRVLGVFGNHVVMIPLYEPHGKLLIRFWDTNGTTIDMVELTVCRGGIVSVLNFHCTAFNHNAQKGSSRGLVMYSFREIFKDNGANLVKLKYIDVNNGLRVTDYTCKLKTFLADYVPKHYSGLECEILRLFGFRVSSFKRREGDLSRDIEEINRKLQQAELNNKNEIAEKFVHSVDKDRYEDITIDPSDRCQSSITGCVVTDNEIIMASDKLDLMRIKYKWNEEQKSLTFQSFDFVSYSIDSVMNFDFKEMFLDNNFIHLYSNKGIITLKKSCFDSKQIRSKFIKVPHLRKAFLILSSRLLLLHDQKISIVNVEVNKGKIRYKDIDKSLGTFFMDNNPFQSFYLYQNHLLINETETEFKLINLNRSFESDYNSRKIHLDPHPTMCPARRKRLKDIVSLDGKFHLIYDL
ncbi:uncharacterized protein CANTADRAFT_6689 [Suhomyces tanzawaensis NRRL Y-17324]|uniref:Uncharacterized protein n=1 Tax=Suhomyces tanzawaensis NRRL Y-17324 TaxID=984487 RepID=A0A1E4SFI8_9ASCO|nr:uncharacterized protein CANTADRAFT_6689 [Suhomyces tanzawaensis NRRL Y-17324]ODV78289.1 hypothetical protein CANTADRAFT_6689 [Suhomyces tanzawaensis NRRL Y-17324]